MLRLRSLVSRPHPAPVFVLGNQKSGTSAIAHLLALATRSSYNQDMLYNRRFEPVAELLQGRRSLDRLVRQMAWEFSHDVIKDPDFTFLYPRLARRFPGARFAFVLREPASNIRSILNRHSLPGTGEAAPLEAAWPGFSPGWRAVFSPEGLGLEPGDYIDILAQRWDRAARVYLENAGALELLRYEEFLADKRGSIDQLARRLGLEPVADITPDMDRQFQPRGDHSHSLEAFFGPANLARIGRWCGESAARLGYRA